MSANLKSVIEENTSKGGRLFDLCVQALIVISLVTYAIATLPDLEPVSRQILQYLEIVIVLLFTIEYLLRLLVADRKWRFAFSFYGLIDLVAIAPFYLALAIPFIAATGLDLRFIRVFRLFRLFRMLKIVRYSKAIRLFGRAFRMAKEELVLFFVVAGMLIYLAAAGIHFFESQAQPDKFTSLFSSLWWAVVTLTTVGYGDMYPITDGGRIFTFFLLMIGLGTIAVPSGIVASSLSKARDMEVGEGKKD
ncbi:MAG: ion transporter [Woeseia sp.]